MNGDFGPSLYANTVTLSTLYKQAIIEVLKSIPQSASSSNQHQTLPSDGLCTDNQLIMPPSEHRQMSTRNGILHHITELVQWGTYILNPRFTNIGCGGGSTPGVSAIIVEPEKEGSIIIGIVKQAVVKFLDKVKIAEAGRPLNEGGGEIAMKSL